MGTNKGNWLPKENLLSFLLILSRQISYDFTAVDWKAIQHGIHDTSNEANIRFSYILPGSLDIELQLANEEGTDLIIFQLTIPENLESNFDFMVDILQDFTLTPDTIKLYE